MLFEDTIKFAMVGAYDAEAEFVVGGPNVAPFGCCVDFAQQLEGAGRGAVDDVNVMDLGATENEGKPNVPSCLLAGTENSDSVDVLSPIEDKG